MSSTLSDFCVVFRYKEFNHHAFAIRICYFTRSIILVFGFSESERSHWLNFTIVHFDWLISL